MERFKRIWNQLTQRIAGERWWGVSAVILAAVGASWLIAGTSEDDRTCVSDRIESPAQFDTARRQLRAHDIDVIVQDGKLLVPADSSTRARRVLSQRPVRKEPGSSLVGSDDIWLTRAASERRRLTGRLATLGRLIGQFDGVVSAEVLYEPVKVTGIGRPRQHPTAAVHVRLEDDNEMTQQMVAAIADLVTGGITGLKPDGVYVIDHRGGSYRVDPEALAVERARRSRAHAAGDCERRVRQALAYIDGMTVVANVDRGQRPRCTTVRVSVPWTYYQAVARRAGTDPLVVSVAESDRISRTVASLLEIDDPRQVFVDVHYDTRLASLPDETTPVPAHSVALELAAGSMLLVGAICALGAIRRARRRRRAMRSVPEQSAADGPLAAMEHLPARDLVWLLAAEGPQTVAIVLKHLSRRCGAQVLAAFDRPQQRQIVQALADLDRVDPETVDSVIASLSQRLDAMRNSAGSKATVAELVKPSADEPDAPARDVRAIAFEDLVDVPGPVLAAALSRVDVRLVAIALRTAGEVIRQRVYKTLGRRRTRRVRKQMDRIGPVRLADVESAQDRLAEAVRRAIASAGPQLMEVAG